MGQTEPHFLSDPMSDRKKVFSNSECSNMYSTIIYGKGRNESFIKIREIRGQKQNGAQEDNTDLYKNWVNSGASEMLAVPASCTTLAMFFIVNDTDVCRIQWFPFKMF